MQCITIMIGMIHSSVVHILASLNTVLSFRPTPLLFIDVPEGPQACASLVAHPRIHEQSNTLNSSAPSPLGIFPRSGHLLCLASGQVPRGTLAYWDAVCMPVFMWTGPGAEGNKDHRTLDGLTRYTPL
uniref:Uncharacterized protein n=1 Tax=Eutreptiella gymnastica TaxID=73025 RepID=A0A7S1IKF9_9EUGL